MTRLSQFHALDAATQGAADELTAFSLAFRALRHARRERVRAALATRAMKRANPQLYGRAATGLPKRGEMGR